MEIVNQYVVMDISQEERYAIHNQDITEIVQLIVLISKKDLYAQIMKVDKFAKI